MGKNGDTIVSVDRLSVTASVSPITVKIRTYYSVYHWWAAKNFTEMVRTIENAHLDSAGSKFDIKHRSYVTACIFSAVAFWQNEASKKLFLKDLLE